MSMPMSQNGQQYGQAGTVDQLKSLKGTGYKSARQQNFTPEQMDLFTRMFGQVGPDSQVSQLAGGDQSQFEQLEAPAMQQFGDLSAGIANRYSGMGQGSRHSSGFQNQQSSAAQNFSQQLQSNRMGLQRQSQQDLQSMYHELLGQRPYENLMLEKEQKQPSFFDKITGGIGNLGGQFVGSLAGGYGGRLANILGGR